MEPDDSELLRTFREEGSQEAFAALARRHGGLLYHAALRLTRRADLAEDAAQNALAILARKAATLTGRPSLAPWLHRTVCYEANKIVRRETRHFRRMEKLSDSLPPEGVPTVETWEKAIPHLDAALNDLSEPDRQVVMLKYIDGWSFEDMARRLGGQAAAWRQRGTRALERLRRAMARRGAVVPLAVLSTGLAATLTQAAPPLVLASLITAPATAAALSWKSLTLHTLHMMNLKQAAVTTSIVVLALMPLGYQAVAIQRTASRVSELAASADALAPETRASLPVVKLPGLPREEAVSAGSTNAVDDLVDFDLREMALTLARRSMADFTGMLRYRALLKRMPADQLATLLERTKTLEAPPAQRAAAAESILSALAAKDPALATARGMEFVASLSGQSAVDFWMNPLPNAVREWAMRDPAAARAWYEEQVQNDGFQDKTLRNADVKSWIAGGVFSGMMWGGDHAGGMEFFATLDNASKTMGLRRYATSNPDTAAQAMVQKLAATLANPEDRVSALMGATMSVAREDFSNTGAYVLGAGLSADETRRLLVAAAVEPLRDGNTIDIDERAQWLRSLTTGAQREKAVGYFLGESAYLDPAVTRRNVDAELAQGASHAFLGAFLRNAARNTNTMDFVAEYLPRLTDPSERQRTLRELQQAHPDAARAVALRAGVTADDLEAAAKSR
jgi:RNA polymerase sigma factor (sigma-70 family)